MNVLVACEFSGQVRDAFRRLGHEAWSSDLPEMEPEGEWPNYHLEGDCRLWLDGTVGPVSQWDLMICHPPCTYLSLSGARWLKDNPERQENKRLAVNFAKELYNSPIPRVCLENPMSMLSRAWRKPDQIVHPCWFGHGETKETWLWLKNLPHLTPTNFILATTGRVHHMAPGPNRTKDRSRTLSGFASAMATQWRGLA